MNFPHLYNASKILKIIFHLGNCYGLPNVYTKPWSVLSTEKPSQNIQIAIIRVNDLQNNIQTTPWIATDVFSNTIRISETPMAFFLIITLVIKI